VRALTLAHWTTRRAAVGLAAFVLLAGLARRAECQLAIDQVEMFLDPQGSGRRVQTFNVSNESDQVVEATLYLNDWDRAEDGENRFSDSGRLPQSCGRYLRVFPLSLRLPPRTQQAVRVALEGADSLSKTCWSVVFVESSAAQESRGGRTITYITRLGVKVYVVPPNLPKDGEIENVELGDSTPRQVIVSFRNSGGVPLWPRGNVEFRRLDASVAATVAIEEFPVLPGSRRRLTIRPPSLPRGRYVALALIDYGGSDISGGQVQLVVP
jgi:P pilus assembly chaperone PapD